MKKILLIFSLFFTLIACEDKSDSTDTSNSNGNTPTEIFTAIDPDNISTMYGTYKLIRNEQYWANGWGGNVTIYPTGTMTCSEELAKCVFRFYDGDGLSYYTNEQFKQPLNQLLSKINLSGNVLKVSDKKIISIEGYELDKQDYYFEKYSDNQVPPRNTPLTTKLTPINKDDEYSIMGTYVIETASYSKYGKEPWIACSEFKINAILYLSHFAQMNGMDRCGQYNIFREFYYPKDRLKNITLTDESIIDEWHVELLLGDTKYTAKKISDEDIYTSETIEPLE